MPVSPVQIRVWPLAFATLARCEGFLFASLGRLTLALTDPQTLAILGAVVSVFAVIAAGALARRANWLTHEADESLLRLLINVLLPCLIFASIVGNDELRKPANIVWPPIIGFATVALGIGLARLLAPLVAPGKLTEQRTFALSAGLHNFGYIPLPLIALLLDGPAAKSTTAVLLVHNVGIEVGLWTLGVLAITGDMGLGALKRVINAPLIAIVVALSANFAGVHSWLPEMLVNAIHMIGESAIPLGIILIGATIADHMTRQRGRLGVRVIGGACALRFALMPAVMMLVAATLPDSIASVELRRVIVLEAAMPAAVFPIVMARHYGGDVPTALRVALGTSIIALLATPLWIKAGAGWAGLTLVNGG